VDGQNSLFIDKNSESIYYETPEVSGTTILVDGWYTTLSEPMFAHFVDSKTNNPEAYVAEATSPITDTQSS
jgi:hypothetical protein